MPAIGDYSTSEQDTGFTWIDGKHIYKKTVNFGALPNATSGTFSHGITNISYIIKIEAISFNNTRWMPLPAASPITVEASVVITADASSIFITTGTDRRTDKAYVTLYYTKSS